MNVRQFVLNVTAPPTGVPGWAKLTSEGGTVPGLWQWVTIPTLNGQTLLSKMDYTQVVGGSKTLAYAFSSATLNPATLDLYFMGGGHGDYGGNEVYKLGLNSEAPEWERLSTPSSPTPFNVAYYPDGRPTSRHTARQLWFHPGRNALMTFGCFSGYSAPGSADWPTVDAWSLATKDYIVPSPFPSTPYSDQTKAHIVLDKHGNVWAQPQGSTVYKWTNSAGAYGAWTTVGTAINHDTQNGVYDSVRDFVIRLPSNYGATVDGTYWSGDPAAAFSYVRLRYAAPPTGEWRGTTWHDTVNDKYVCLRWLPTPTAYTIDPQQMITSPMNVVATERPMTNTPTVVGDSGIYSFYNRFHYVEALKGFVLLATVNGPSYFMRTA